MSDPEGGQTPGTGNSPRQKAGCSSVWIDEAYLLFKVDPAAADKVT